MVTFQELISRLHQFWTEQGCIIEQPYDIEKGAGTLSPLTFLRCLGPEPFNAAYVEPCRRPTDGRYGENPNRLQHYFQYQVVLKPSPPDIQSVYIDSLKAIGLDLSKHDIRFVHDDWENPTIGAAGLGWEAWIDGMEVTQITYFQVLGSLPVKPVTGELTYGLERLAMYLQNVESVYDLQWTEDTTYGELYKEHEFEWSRYNFEEADIPTWRTEFEAYEKEALKLIQQNLVIPAYDFVMKASHAFNMLDARGAISVTERTGYIGRIRDLAKGVASGYIKFREARGFPLLSKLKTEERPSPPPTRSSVLGESEDFLLEIGSEELPATFVPVGMQNLEKDLTNLLKKEDLAYDKVEVFGTPRRLAIKVKALQTQKNEKKVERKGPSVEKAFDENGTPTKAAGGFFKSLEKEPLTLQEIESGAEPSISIQKTDKGNYLFAQQTVPAVQTKEVLEKTLPSLIGKLNFPKKMRWSNLDDTYARPILWIVALFGKSTLEFSYANISASYLTYGHRQLSPEEVALNHPDEYLASLENVNVLVDPTVRKASILSQLEEIEKQLGATALEKETLTQEVLHLVEKPFLVTADFDPSFLKVPKELLVCEMVEHQKYFPLEKDGKLLPQFVITANNTPSDKICRGNCKVLTARLSDGLFLFNQDIDLTIEKMNEKLDSVTFQKKLGSMKQKVGRLISLSKKIAGKEIPHLETAASLLKADLTSHAVFEFPELQGVMGKYYALHEGHPEEVAVAIEEHWMPRSEKGALPSTPLGKIVSLADKIDNLTAFFAIGLKPSSSSDPYALRRQAMGLLKILISNQQHLPLRELLHFSFDQIDTQDKKSEEECIDELIEFLSRRLKTVLEDEGFSKDVIDASLSHGKDLDPYDQYLRVSALDQFREKRTEFNQLYEVFKRAKGQLASLKSPHFDPALLEEPAEISLSETLEQVSVNIHGAIDQHNYGEAFLHVAKLQPPLALLFDEVKILDENPDVQTNRLTLLKKVFDHFGLLLDFSKIKADK